MDKPQENINNSENGVDKIFDKFSDTMHDMNFSNIDKDFINNHLKISKETAREIQKKTKNQSNCKQWYMERRKRITASNFGAIINRRKDIYPMSIIKKLTCNKTFKTDATKWGLENEHKAIQKYEQLYNVKILQSGLIVNPKWPWLGCSPDGIVDGCKGIEVKCPYSFRDFTITECCKDKKFFMTLKNNEPVLKESHQYYIQCQGVMAIAELDTLDFVVYTEKGLYVQCIKFNKDKWDNTFLPELTNFYFNILKDKIFEEK